MMQQYDMMVLITIVTDPAWQLLWKFRTSSARKTHIRARAFGIRLRALAPSIEEANKMACRGDDYGGFCGKEQHRGR
jgi:hypothetical protein